MGQGNIMRRLLFSDHIRSKGNYFLQKSGSRTSVTSSSSQPLLPPNPPEITTLIKDKVNQVMLGYEDFIGIKQVKEAQNRVLSAESCLRASQQQRRAAQEKLTQVQNQLRILRGDIDRTARGDNRYLELIKNEIDIIREEREVRSRFEELEERERELFSELSNALRMSHEKERAQGEKTKYWSIFGSLVGAFLGILGTTINTRMRHQQTRDILLQTSSHVATIEASVQALSLRLGVEPIVNNNNTLNNPENVANLFRSIQEQEKLLRIVTTTVESLASQLQRNNQIGRDASSGPLLPLYWDFSQFTPASISREKGAAIVTLLFLVVGAFAYTRY